MPSVATTSSPQTFLSAHVTATPTPIAKIVVSRSAFAICLATTLRLVTKGFDGTTIGAVGSVPYAQASAFSNLGSNAQSLYNVLSRKNFTVDASYVKTGIFGNSQLQDRLQPEPTSTTTCSPATTPQKSTCSTDSRTLWPPAHRPATLSSQLIRQNMVPRPQVPLAAETMATSPFMTALTTPESLVETIGRCTSRMAGGW